MSTTLNASPRILCDGAGNPIRVSICNGPYVLCTLDLEAFEQLAAQIDYMRLCAGDGRYVCRRHGYHEEAICSICKEARL